MTANPRKLLTFSVASFHSSIFLVTNPNLPTANHVAMTAKEARRIAVELTAAAVAVERAERGNI